MKVIEESSAISKESWDYLKDCIGTKRKVDWDKELKELMGEGE